MDKTIYVIKSYKSVNDFLFGARIGEVKKKCGAPFKSEIDNIQEIVTEIREACELIYEEKRLSYVTLNEHTQPMIEGIDIFADGGIKALENIDANHIIGPRYINFRTLGVCVGGFSKKKIPEGKLVIAYGKGKESFFDFFTQD